MGKRCRGLAGRAKNLIGYNVRMKLRTLLIGAISGFAIMNILGCEPKEASGAAVQVLRRTGSPEIASAAKSTTPLSLVPPKPTDDMRSVIQKLKGVAPEYKGLTLAAGNKPVEISNIDVRVAHGELGRMGFTADGALGKEDMTPEELSNFVGGVRECVQAQLMDRVHLDDKARFKVIAFIEVGSSTVQFDNSGNPSPANWSLSVHLLVVDSERKLALWWAPAVSDEEPTLDQVKVGICQKLQTQLQALLSKSDRN